MQAPKTILIYDDQIDGHHLEYIHHLYTGARLHPDLKIIFVIPELFLKVKDRLKWDLAPNVRFIHIKEKNIYRKGNIFLKSYRISRHVNFLAKQNNVKEVFFITLMPLLPSIIFFFKAGFKVSGIIYQIYIYRWNRAPLLLKIEDIFKYLILSRCSIFKTLYLLNDPFSVHYINKKYSTSKFQYLPDPFVPLSTPKIQNMRSELNILPDNKILLHFGAIAKRKGSLNILKAISFIPESDLLNLTFIFAGRIDEEIREEFYEIYNCIKDKTQIIIYDKFCEYDFIASLCCTCDFILIPYLITSHSSGVIGYAAQFKKPVVAPQEGLLGKIIRKNKLGILLTDSTVKSIQLFISNINNYSIDVKSNYLDSRTVFQFNKTIFNQFYV